MIVGGEREVNYFLCFVMVRCELHVWICALRGPLRVILRCMPRRTQRPPQCDMILFYDYDSIIFPTPLMRYVDGYILPVPAKHIKLYQKMAKEAGKIWLECGALQYIEAVGDDVKKSEWADIAFPDAVHAKKTEKVIFAFVVYKSRKHRDQVNKKVFAHSYMNDPALKEKMKPFDMQRMAYGGFQAIVDLAAQK